MNRRASKNPSTACLTLPALALCLAPFLPAHAAEPDAHQALPAAATRATIDRETGRLRAPEADEPAPTAAQGAAAASRSAVPQSMLRSPNALRFQAQTMYGRDGSETRRLDLGRALRFSVAHRHADGSLHKDCVVGEDAVHTHLSAPLTATAAKGANNE